MAREIRDTKGVRAALALAQTVMAAEEHPMGEIVGPSGTGKTFAGLRVAEQMGAHRLVCWDGITRHQLAREVGDWLGFLGAGAVDRLLAARQTADPASRRMVIVDEANKLNWRGLELLRYLADECNLAVILIGTDLYERQFVAPRTRELLVQLGRRIGAKRVATAHLDRADTYTHCLKPVLGEVADRDLITKFWQGCRRGNFGDGMELARECRRVMDANGITVLTEAVLDASLQWMANRRETGREVVA